MVIREVLSKTGDFARILAHFSRLGKVASQRSFLNREKKKLLLKLGEKTMEQIESKRIESPQLFHIVKNIEKIDSLLRKIDYGGERGTAFVSSEKKTPKTKRRERKIRRKE